MKHIEDAESHPPQMYRSLSPGLLDDVIQEPRHPARVALVWNNLYLRQESRPIHNRAFAVRELTVGTLSQCFGRG
jgi:hypothetical protein